MPPPRPLRLPPPYEARWSAQEAPFDAAVRGAPAEGAGLLLWRLRSGGGRAGLLEWAVVLEPDRPLKEARLAALVGMNALADAVAAHAPPERAARLVWPMELRFDAGRLGGGRLAAAPGCAEEEAPAWMVFGAELLADRSHLKEPGERPGSTSLLEEGFSDPPALVESFASYLMLGFDRWAHEGIGPLLERFEARLEPREGRLSANGGLTQGASRRELRDWADVAPWRGAEGPLL